MFCSKCGKQNLDNAKFCSSCGTPFSGTTQPQYAPPPQSQYTAQPAVAQHTSGMAIASLVFGIIGGSLFAIIFGAVALGQIGKNPNLSGKGLAIAGIILGVLWMIILVIIIAAGVLTTSYSGY